MLFLGSVGTEQIGTNLVAHLRNILVTFSFFVNKKELIDKSFNSILKNHIRD